MEKRFEYTMNIPAQLSSYMICVEVSVLADNNT